MLKWLQRLFTNESSNRIKQRNAARFPLSIAITQTNRLSYNYVCMYIHIYWLEATSVHFCQFNSGQGPIRSRSIHHDPVLFSSHWPSLSFWRSRLSWKISNHSLVFQQLHIYKGVSTAYAYTWMDWINCFPNSQIK